MAENWNWQRTNKKLEQVAEANDEKANRWIKSVE